MIFSSLEFVCVFLPVVLVLYSMIPSLRMKNGLLIIASLLFYAYGEPVYVLLMIGSVAVNYIFARLIAAGRCKKAFLFISVIFNLGVLAVFKYTGFIVTSINDALSVEIHIPEIALPIGISFFTFQALSYVIDVYRGDTAVQKNFFKVLLYISFFPQLIAGPIIKYHDISKALSDRKQSFEAVSFGMRRFIFGLAKKVLIANAVGEAADMLFGAELSHINFISAWLAAIAYMLQIYYDFSGYSDMAIGLGQMFGFQFAENFRYPYAAASIKDFWHRWHISLSTWFKEYLYIPLGGNRKGKVRTSLNKLIVFFMTGLWHGASWTFVIWGLYHGLFLLIEDWFRLPKANEASVSTNIKTVGVKRKLFRILGHIYSLLVVCIGFVIFRSENMQQAFSMIGRMFGTGGFSDGSRSLMWQMLTPYFIIMLIAGILFAAPIPALARWINARFISSGNMKMRSFLSAILYAVSMLMLVWCMLRLSGNTYNPFIYFRF
ncbi:MAG: MBOAT family protein [Coprococcus sp.]|nr:MBOAT family protein [Coprococcus sp.]